MRVDYENYFIQPGYPKPFSGTTYELGQYSPSEISLSATRLMEAKEAGLFFEPSLDIYDEEGNVSEEKVEKVNHLELLQEMFKNIDSIIPRYAALNVYATLKRIPKKFFEIAQIKKLTWVKKKDIKPEPNDYYICGHIKHDNYYEFLVYQPYYLYLVVPLVRPIVNITPGMSVASYATAKTFARILFYQLAKYFPETIEMFLEERGWSREKEEGYYQSGQLYGLPTQKQFYHKNDSERFSYATTFSPVEDFVETFVYYYYHRAFLQNFPTPYDFWRRLEKILKL